MLKGKLGNGVGFSINYFGLHCDDKSLITSLQRTVRQCHSLHTMLTQYEAETIMGELFVSKYGGEITQPSDQPNITGWGLASAELEPAAS